MKLPFGSSPKNKIKTRIKNRQNKGQIKIINNASLTALFLLCLYHCQFFSPKPNFGFVAAEKDDEPSAPSSQYKDAFTETLMRSYIPLSFLKKIIQENEKSIGIFRNVTAQTMAYNDIINQVTSGFSDLIKRRQLALQQLRDGVQQVFDDSILVKAPSKNGDQNSKILGLNGDQNGRGPNSAEISSTSSQSSSKKNDDIQRPDYINYDTDIDPNQWKYCSAREEQIPDDEEPKALPYQIISSEDYESNKEKYQTENCYAIDKDLTNICRRNIMVNRDKSLALTPIPIYGREGEALKIGNLTQQLDDYFKKNANEANTNLGVEWQYFAHWQGLFRFYPGVKWVPLTVKKNNNRKPLGYDPRLESWYLQSLTVRKDILILLDTSGSMTGNKIDIAREAIQHLLYTLNEEDNINIVTFAGDADKTKTEYKYLEPCFKKEWKNETEPTDTEMYYQEIGMLVPATQSNKLMLIKRLQKINPSGKSDDQVIRKAVDTYQIIRKATSNKARFQKEGYTPPSTILIVTDGFQDTQDFSGTQYKDLQDTYSIYTFLVDSTVDSSTKSAKKIACHHNGKTFELNSKQNLVRHVIDFLINLHRRGFAHNLTNDSSSCDKSSSSSALSKKQRTSTNNNSSSQKQQNTPKKGDYWPSYENGIWTQPYPSRVLGHNESANFDIYRSKKMAVRDEWVMTVSLPVESNNKKIYTQKETGSKIENECYREFIGVVGVELPMKKIYELIKPYRMGPMSYIIVYKRISGKVIIHPALRNGIVLENKEFVNSGIYETRVANLEPDLFDFDTSTNRVTLANGLETGRFNIVSDHRSPLDPLGNSFKRITSYVKDVEIEDSPFNIMFVFEPSYSVVNQASQINSQTNNSSDNSTTDNNTTNQNFRNSKTSKFHGSVYYAGDKIMDYTDAEQKLKSFYATDCSNKNNDIMTSQTFDYKYMMCGLYNALNAQIKNTDAKDKEDGQVAQARNPITGNTLSLVDKWQFCSYNNEDTIREKGDPICNGYQPQITLIRNYLKSYSQRSEVTCDIKQLHRLALETTATATFDGKIADRVKEIDSPGSNQNRCYFIDPNSRRSQYAGLEEVFLITASGLKRSYVLLPNNERSIRFWNLDMNSFTEARYPFFYQNQVYRKDEVTFAWYPETDVILATTNLATSSIASEPRPLNYGVIGAILNREEFLTFMERNLECEMENQRMLGSNNNNLPDEKFNCDIYNCYLVTTEAKVLGVLKNSSGEYLRRNEPLKRFENQMLSDVDVDLWRAVVNSKDGYGKIFKPMSAKDSQQRDNQALCKLKYGATLRKVMDEAVAAAAAATADGNGDGNTKFGPSPLASQRASIREEQMLFWNLTFIEQSKLKHWYPWMSRNDPNYIEAFNQYFRCTQEIQRYQVDEQELIAYNTVKRLPRIERACKYITENKNIGTSVETHNGWVFRYNGSADTTTNLLLIVTSKCNRSDELVRKANGRGISQMENNGPKISIVNGIETIIPDGIDDNAKLKI